MTAHNSWAAIYDQVNQASFGGMIDALTRKTLEVVPTLVENGGSVLDAGAGTGRVSLELANLGYDVEAIDASEGMTEKHQAKAAEHGFNYPVIHSPIQKYEPTKAFDLVVCVHTVTAYLHTDEMFDAAIDTFKKSLKPGGRILIDLANPILFQDSNYRDDVFDRQVSFAPMGDNRFIYHEETTIECDGEEVSYEDTFSLRAWSRDEFELKLSGQGFMLEKDLSNDFLGSGHYYLVFKRDE